MMMSQHATTTHFGIHATMMADHSPGDAEGKHVVKSRFGEIVIDPAKAMMFPKGMLGMPDARNFALANFPSEKMQQFKLLQSLDDIALSFITLPAVSDTSIISRADTLEACRELGIAEDNLLLLLVVCVHRTPEATKLSVNARAPIFIDVSRMVGVQYVFTHDAYKVQHYIT